MLVQLKIEKKEEQNTSKDISQPVESTHKVAYPSAGLLLQCARDEYDKERDRTRNLDNKASFFMSAIILVATIFIPIIPFSEIKSIILHGTCSERWLVGIFGVVMVVSFIILLLAFKSLYDAFKIKEFWRYESKNMDDIVLHSSPPDVIESTLCENYRKIVETNIEANDGKALSVNKGLKLCAIGFLILAISAIGVKFVV